jgi:hypothetical protein
MKFTKIKNLSNEAFRRLTGIKRKTFDKMIEILNEAEKIKMAQGGKPNILSMEDRLLMTLEYLREYRTYFHISQSYGISESACWRNIQWIESTLVKSKEFRLPGKKALLKSDHEYEVVLVDATESPIERPKKNSASITPERKSGTP